MKKFKKTDKLNEQGQWIIEVEETKESKSYKYRTPLELEATIAELQAQIVLLQDELREVRKLQT